MGCHPELDSGSHVVVCHVKRKVGKIPNQVWNDNSPIGEGNGINSITNLSPSRPNALLTNCSTLVLRLAMNAVLDLLHAHRVSPFGLCPSWLNLFAIRTYNSVVSSVRKFATARFCAKSSTLLSSQARLFASKACFVAPLGLAFTMAEILLSLTIIGVVAAITLPSLTGNINERTWNTQRKALYSRISQTIALMPSVNGYGIGATEEETKKHATETFITAGLAKVLKINNICDRDHWHECGLACDVNPMSGSKFYVRQSLYQLSGYFNYQTDPDGDGVYTVYFTVPDTNIAAFETANGESIVTYYNPYCRNKDAYVLNESGDKLKYAQQFMCVNFLYDLNGKKGPNTMGKDMGAITVFYPTDSTVVMPMPVNTIKKDVTFVEATNYCKGLDGEYRMPTYDEWGSMFVNRTYWGGNINVPSNGNFRWTSSISDDNPTLVRVMDVGNGNTGLTLNKNTGKAGVNCIKRF